jgi:hypothetical protein
VGGGGAGGSGVGVVRAIAPGYRRQFNLDLSGQAPGLYLIEVLDEGRPIGSLKAIVK